MATGGIIRLQRGWKGENRRDGWWSTAVAAVIGGAYFDLGLQALSVTCYQNFVVSFATTIRSQIFIEIIVI